MNDDMLSQEEINELLKGVGASENDDDRNENKELQIDDYLTEIEIDALGEIGNISFGTAATALSTLLNQKVDITTPTLSIIKRTQLHLEFPRPHVAVNVKFTDGFEGMNLLVIKTTDAAVIADLMLGGNGLDPASDMSEMYLSAVQEAMNQMMGSSSTSMSTIFNKRVDISPPSISLMDITKGEGTSYLPKDDTLVKISFRLKIGELVDSTIMQLVTVPFAKQLVEELMNLSASKSSNEPNPSMLSEQMHDEDTLFQQSNRHGQSQKHQQGQTNSQPKFEQRGKQHLGSTYQQPYVDVQPAAFSQFNQPELSQNEAQNLDMLLDIPLQVTVELGRTKRSIKEILDFTQGSIIELDKLAGEPVDILVNSRLIAKGEVVVIDENFGVRVTDIVSKVERINNLK